MFEKVITSFVSSDCFSWLFKCLCCNFHLSWSYYNGQVEIETSWVGTTSSKVPIDLILFSVSPKCIFTIYILVVLEEGNFKLR